MMAWEREYALTVTDLSRDEVWRAWEDVNHWNRWDDDLEFARLDGAFKKGERFTLKPKGGPRVTIELAEVERLASFTDLTRFPLARMWGTHELRDSSRGLVLRSVIRVDGPLAFLWRKIVAEGVARGLERQTHRLIAYVREQTCHGQEGGTLAAPVQA
jgi:polyketide cyclase/dehydrase/lipid transport protein